MNTKVREIAYLTKNLNPKELTGWLKSPTMAPESCKTIGKRTNVVVGYKYYKIDHFHRDLSYLVSLDKSK